MPALILGVTLGTIVGVTSGYFGGKTDQIIMRFVDWFLAIPSLLLAILVINMSRQRFSDLDESWLVILTIGISFMPNNSRVIRSAALAIKPLEFVQSARLRGEPTIYIMFREILPNVLPVVAVEAAIRLSFALLLTAGLGFLGLGVQPPSSDWGLMVSENFRHIGQVPLAGSRSGHGNGVARRRHKPARRRHPASAKPARKPEDNIIHLVPSPLMGEG